MKGKNVTNETIETWLIDDNMRMKLYAINDERLFCYYALTRSLYTIIYNKKSLAYNNDNCWTLATVYFVQSGIRQHNRRGRRLN